jgi:hypothetical protein
VAQHRARPAPLVFFLVPHRPDAVMGLDGRVGYNAAGYPGFGYIDHDDFSLFQPNRCKVHVYVARGDPAFQEALETAREMAAEASC